MWVSKQHGQAKGDGFSGSIASLGIPVGFVCAFDVFAVWGPLLARRVAGWARETDLVGPPHEATLWLASGGCVPLSADRFSMGHSDAGGEVCAANQTGCVHVMVPCC